MKTLDRLGTLVLLLATLVAVASIAINGVERAVLHESGAVEILSAMLWLFAAAYIVLGQVPDTRFAGWLAGLFTLFFLRELDFHDWWFEPGLLHVQLLTGSAPLWQKVVSAVTMLAIIATIVAVLWLGLRRFVKAVRDFDLSAWLVLIAMGCAAISSQLDGLGRKLEPYGVDITTATQDAAIVVEETLEIAFPMLIIQAISVAIRRRQVG